jgi:ribonuclease P protein component
MSNRRTPGSHRKARQYSPMKQAGRASLEPGVTSTASSKFPKSKRLLKHGDFQRVYQNGRRQFTGNMTVFFLLRGSSTEDARLGDAPRVGFTVGKVVGESVERNRIRRRMREAVRHAWQAVHGPVDVVFNPRRSVLTLPYPELANEVSRGLRLAVERARTQPNQGLERRS